MLINLGYRLVGYVAAPWIDRATLYLQETVDKVPLEKRKLWILRVAQFLRPLFLALDYLRLGLVGLYVHERKCLRVLDQNISILNSLAYRGEEFRPGSPATWTAKDAAAKQTVLGIYPVILLLSPVFFLADYARFSVCSYLNPQLYDKCESVLNTIWAVQYGSVVIS